MLLLIRDGFTRGGGVCTPLALARGGAGGVLYFMINPKIITDKMRYSNTVVKQDFAVVKQVDGRAAHMTDTTRHQSWQSTPPPPPPLPDHSGSIPAFAKAT
jgi:hypothetical protein